MLSAISSEHLKVLTKKIEFAIDSLSDSNPACVSRKKDYPENDHSKIRRLLTKFDQTDLDDANFLRCGIASEKNSGIRSVFKALDGKH